MSTTPFTYDAIAGRVVFGAGSRHRLGAELDRLGSERVVVIASTSEDAIAAELTTGLGDRVVGRFADVVQHVPVDRAAAAVAAVTAAGADAIVTVGGGSATGFGKAVRLESAAAFVAVPTTYAGSEMTTIWGRTEGDDKQTGIDPRVKPDTVIYDPELTLTLPPSIAGPSGMNALAHCVEALYGPGANPVISLISLEGVRALATGLPAVCRDPDDVDARTDALYGAYLAGVALASGGTALHHKTCHVLGGMFNLNHGDMNAVVLGHAIAYNAPAIPVQLARLGAALGTDDVAGALFDLAGAIGAPTSLEEIGMPADGIDAATPRVVQHAAANVRRPDEASIRRMLDDAFHGRRPTSVPHPRSGGSGNPDDPWRRPGSTDDTGIGDVHAADLDWVRRRIVLIDDELRALPRDDFAGRDRLQRITDDLRTILRAGNGDALASVRAGWDARAGRKGGHEVDYEALAWLVRSMVPGPGTGSA